MAPLSRELPHEHYGSLDADGKTVDEELEKANFAFAGRMLSESSVNISRQTNPK